MNAKRKIAVAALLAAAVIALVLIVFASRSTDRQAPAAAPAAPMTAENAAAQSLRETQTQVEMLKAHQRRMDANSASQN